MGHLHPCLSFQLEKCNESIEYLLATNCVSNQRPLSIWGSCFMPQTEVVVRGHASKSMLLWCERRQFIPYNGARKTFSLRLGLFSINSANIESLQVELSPRSVNIRTKPLYATGIHMNVSIRLTSRVLRIFWHVSLIELENLVSKQTHKLLLLICRRMGDNG